MYYTSICFAILCCSVSVCNSNLQAGPDPWHYEDLKLPTTKDESPLPPDLRTPLKKAKQTETKYGFGEWWFKRLLTIMLKSGQVKKNEDGIDVSLQMKFDEEKWGVLEECLKSESTLSDVMFRRVVSYVEDGIYKPTITDKIAMAWTDYVQVYLTEYKVYITWIFGITGALGALVWLWRYVSPKHIFILIFALLYIYEVIISYKEAEQKEYEKLMSAVNACKWMFWSSECSLPSADPILFMKHMNPLKIAIRMFTSLISEPIIAINSTVKVTIHDITDELWFPFDKIVYGILIVIINISLIYLLIMIVFNFIFNIPFNLNFLGIVSVGVKQNRRSFIPSSTGDQKTFRDSDRISGDRLDKILNVCSLALTNVQNRESTTKLSANSSSLPKLQRSASTGRLSALCSTEYNGVSKLPVNNNLNLKKRHPKQYGDGDH